MYEVIGTLGMCMNNGDIGYVCEVMGILDMCIK